MQPYEPTWAMQRALHERVSRGDEPESWIFVEHPPVVTLGRNAKNGSLLQSPEALRARGIGVFQIERGGDVTYHGPGQLVVYPIRKLERFREVAPLVRALESAVIETCASFGVAAERWKEHAGVWAGQRQICAVGLAVRQMTSLHGIALNAATDLTYDGFIHPCGLTDRGITSLTLETGRRIGIAEVKPVLASAIERAFGIVLQRVEGHGSIL